MLRLFLFLLIQRLSLQSRPHEEKSEDLKSLDSAEKRGQISLNEDEVADQFKNLKSSIQNDRHLPEQLDHEDSFPNIDINRLKLAPVDGETSTAEAKCHHFVSLRSLLQVLSEGIDALFEGWRNSVAHFAAQKETIKKQLSEIRKDGEELETERRNFLENYASENESVGEEVQSHVEGVIDKEAEALSNIGNGLRDFSGTTQDQLLEQNQVGMKFLEKSVGSMVETSTKLPLRQYLMKLVESLTDNLRDEKLVVGLKSIGQTVQSLFDGSISDGWQGVHTVLNKLKEGGYEAAFCEKQTE